jgi:hypothetical protein
MKSLPLISFHASFCSGAGSKKRKRKKEKDKKLMKPSPSDWKDVLK